MTMHDLSDIDDSGWFQEEVRECTRAHNEVCFSITCKVKGMQTSMVMMETVAMGHSFIISDTPNMVTDIVGIQRLGISWF